MRTRASLCSNAATRSLSAPGNHISTGPLMVPVDAHATSPQLQSKLGIHLDAGTKDPARLPRVPRDPRPWPETPAAVESEDGPQPLLGRDVLRGLRDSHGSGYSGKRFPIRRCRPQGRTPRAGTPRAGMFGLPRMPPTASHVICVASLRHCGHAHWRRPRFEVPGTGLSAAG
jgi:hypothetical protein